MAFPRFLLAALLACCLTLPLWAQPGPTAPVVLVDAPATAAGRRALATADEQIADAVREARRTLPAARKRYLAGLPASQRFLLLVRVVEADTVFRTVAARVIGWRDGRVQALLPNGPTATATTAPTGEQVPVSFPETAILDWTIVRNDGREEGNYVGRYLETAQRLEALPFR